MRIKPLHNRVLIKPDEVAKTTKGGLVLPDSVAEKPVKGRVIATGTGTVLENGEVQPMNVKTDDLVLFVKGSGIEVKADNEELLMLFEHEIIAVIN